MAIVSADFGRRPLGKQERVILQCIFAKILTSDPLFRQVIHREPWNQTR